MFYENPDNVPPRTSPTGPKIPLKRRVGPTGPKIPLGGSGEQSRISRTVGVLMIASAAIIDFIQFILTFIPIVGWIISWFVSICAWIVFGIWFSHHNVSLFSSSRVLGTLGAMLGEALPIINSFPWWTARISVAVKYEWSKGSAV